MKYISKTIIAILILVAFYSSYSFYQLREELFTVYDVPDKYAYTSKDADLTIVDFNKYSCDLCQKLHPVLMEAIKRDGKVRYIPRSVTHEFTWNETLSSAVYAAEKQGKFIEMHNGIYKNWPVEKHKDLFIYAQRIGLDKEKLSRDMSDPEIRDRVKEDQRYFNDWNLYRTPALLIKNTNNKKDIYIPNKILPTVEELLEIFKKARS